MPLLPLLATLAFALPGAAPASAPVSARDAGAPVLSAVALPVAHAAAVCADYPNQAAAQRAHDTRDGDGDGIYCEDLPCPCLKPSSGSSTGGGTGSRRNPVGDLLAGLGRSVDLSRVTHTGGCHVHGKLPDRGCTPGTRFKHATRAKVCRSGYASAVRNVSAATKDAVYAAYGMARHFDGADGEVDHLVSLELGGTNARANLFPEAAPGSHQKDRLETALHGEVCAGQISLGRAQREIARNWVAAYRARFGRR